VLSGEENFQDMFANAGSLPDPEVKRLHIDEYGLSPTRPVYNHGWEAFHDRFDVAREPNEPFRFGWIVEVDPYQPQTAPRKRTALGRCRHEAATCALTKSNRVAVYSGDDQVFQYVYKFVSKGVFEPGRREAAGDLLDEGVLYAARFNDDGTGQWLPLVHGQGPLTVANGFRDQGDVLINTRGAARLLGATAMDRPEDIEPDPRTGLVYIVLTNNRDRGQPGKAPPDQANPRARNTCGHIIEMKERDGDHASDSFEWSIVLLGGPPAAPTLACPDNVAFGPAGLLWVATDGAPKSIQFNDGLFSVPLAGSDRGVPRQFLSAPTGAEVCGPEFTPDNRTLFIAIQHPGEDEAGRGSSFEKPTSRWPDFRPDLPPRHIVVAIRKLDRGVIGT
jgi:secreted PhoX family phosphatase